MNWRCCNGFGTSPPLSSCDPAKADEISVEEPKDDRSDTAQQIWQSFSRPACRSEINWPNALLCAGLVLGPVPVLKGKLLSQCQVSRSCNWCWKQLLQSTKLGSGYWWCHYLSLTGGWSHCQHRSKTLCSGFFFQSDKIKNVKKTLKTGFIKLFCPVFLVVFL